MQTYRFLSTVLLMITILPGCSSVSKHSSLKDARNDYNIAQNNPQVANLAASELKEAGDALEKANDASKKNKKTAEVNHLAYLAKQRIAIAQETAKQKEAESTVANAESERNKVRLEARTEEATKAQQEAEASQREAEASRQQSEILQQQSDISQQEAREAEMRASQVEEQLKELNAKKTERGLVITLGDVLFDTNKAVLKSGSTSSLKKLADFLKEYPQRKVQIGGYTDSIGSAEYNEELSGRRANAVRAALLEMGISGDRISTHGYGEESPVASNDTPAGRQMNRRVEIILSDDNGNISSLP